MSGKLMSLIPCRIFGLVASAAGILGLALSVLFLSWAKFGPPAAVTHEIEKSITRMEFMHVCLFLGFCLFIFGFIHAVIGAFALLGRIWPMLLGTMLWGVFLLPSLFAAKATAYEGGNVIVLGFLSLLTLFALAGRLSDPDPRHLPNGMPA